MIQVKELNSIYDHRQRAQYMVDRFDMNTLVELRKNFNIKKKKGTICLCEFEDDIWHVKDREGKKHRIIFILEDHIKKNLKKIRISEKEFIDALKYFCVLRINSKPALTVKNNIDLINKLSSDSHCYCQLPELILDVNEMKLIEYWFEWAAIEAYEFLDAIKSTVVTPKKSKARDLADFQTYFKFDKEIREFWKVASNEEKIFYYPLWLFWILTTILPLRVCEFVATPYNCIEHINGKWYVTIRRLTTKGSNKLVHNDLNDFKLCTYEVPEALAMDFEDYKNLIKDNGFEEFQRTETRLFSTQMLQKYAHYSIYQDLNLYFTTNHLRKLKDRFMQEVIVDKMQYKLITRELIEEEIKAGTTNAELELDEISEWSCGDTRHLAMINLIMKGCSPMLIKDFAGHTTSDMSAHYYSNAYKMVKTSLFNEIGSKRVIDVPQSKKLTMSRYGENDCIPCPAGFCKSKNYIIGSGIDCIKVKKCESCNYLIRQRTITTEEHDWHSKRIQDDFNLLLKLVFTGPEYDFYEVGALIQSLLRKQRQYGKALIDEREEVNWADNENSKQSI